MCYDVEYIARLWVDDWQTMDAVRDQRVDGVKE
jgi:hypothetical protein